MDSWRRLVRCAPVLATRSAAVDVEDRPVLTGVKPRRLARANPGVFGRALTPAPRGPERGSYCRRPACLGASADQRSVTCAVTRFRFPHIAT